MEYRIIIVGNCYYLDYQRLEEVLDTYIKSLPDNSSIVIINKNDANGVDKMAEAYAKNKKYLLETFEVDWNIGSYAARFRNAQMADYASLKKGVLFAFWDGQSRNVGNMIETAKKYDLEIHEINIQGGI